jgi:hypothetical protein
MAGERHGHGMLCANRPLQFHQSAQVDFQKEEFTMPIYGVPLLAVRVATILQTTNSHQYVTRTMIQFLITQPVLRKGLCLI